MKIIIFTAALAKGMPCKSATVPAAFLSLVMATLALAQEPTTFDDVQLGSNGIWAAPDGQLYTVTGCYVFRHREAVATT